MSDLYFAYGSNLKWTWLVERVPSAARRGIAHADGVRVVIDKLGRDGTGKANLAAHPGGRAWGFLYRLDADGWRRLDGFEGGYARLSIDVTDEAGAAVSAQTYRAIEPIAGLAALEGYRALIVEGAREHGLPDAYVAQLLALPVR